ncbi:MAG: hypothetical protein U9P14_02120 [Gemmatimonadota bacterium]|nr:hypothetical protein [Gemmatimonadota bacterium]
MKRIFFISQILLSCQIVISYCHYFTSIPVFLSRRVAAWWGRSVKLDSSRPVGYNELLPYAHSSGAGRSDFCQLAKDKPLLDTMDDVREAIEDLIEETCLRNLNDDQITRRVRKFTELCEEMIFSRVANGSHRQQLIERLEIMKCFYNHSSVPSGYGGSQNREIGERQRNRRLSNIVKKRRMALRMIERTDPEVAHAIEQRLEKELPGRGSPGKLKDNFSTVERFYPPLLSPQHMYFLYFNLFLLILLLGLISLVVK